MPLIPKSPVSVRRQWLLGALFVGCVFFLSPFLLLLHARRQIALDRSLVGAVKKADAEAVERLLNDGAEANAQDKVVSSPSYWHVLVQMVKRKTQAANGDGPTCLNLTMETFIRGPYGWYAEPLDEANAKKIVSLLLSHGARVDAQGPLREYPLCVACRDLRWDTAELLVEHGANVNVKDETNNTPLLYAAFHNGHPTAMFLLQHGANPNVQALADHWTPMMWAIVGHDTDLVKALIRYGADINFQVPGLRGPKTPLSYARFLGWCPDIVHVLVNAGAGRNIQ